MALKANGDKVMTSVVLTRAQKQKLEEQAQRLGIGISALIRIAVTEWLEIQPKN